MVSRPDTLPVKIGKRTTDDSFTQQMIFKCLVCARHWDHAGNTVVSKTDPAPVFVEAKI